MTNDNNQRVYEDREEAALELLMEEYAEVEGEALWREFQAAEAAAEGPKAWDREDRKRRRGSEETDRRSNFLKRFGNGCKRTAAIFLILACLLSPLITSVEALKLPVLNYLVVLSQTFSGFNFGKNDDLSQENIQLIDLILTVPCPEGYRFVRQVTTANGKIWLIFERDGVESLKISICPSEGQVNIDTEDVDQVSMEIHGYETVYLNKNGHRLMWLDAQRERVFDIFAFDLEEDAFWKYVYVLIPLLSQ